MAICTFYQPLVGNKPTSYEIAHSYIPPVPQYAILEKEIKRPALGDADKIVKDETYKSTIRSNFVDKHQSEIRFGRPKNLIDFRPIQEKIFKKHLPPMDSKMSIMKDDYRWKSVPSLDHITAPSVAGKCLPVRFGVEQQPAIPIERGSWKYLDIYLTTNKLDYNLKDPNNPLTGKILTFYNEKDFVLPPKTGDKTVSDFKKKISTGLCFSSAPTHVPNRGLLTETQEKYRPKLSLPTDHCIELVDNFGVSGRWQNLCPPGMYCTEYCNYGRRAVRSTVNTDVSPKCCLRKASSC